EQGPQRAAAGGATRPRRGRTAPARRGRGPAPVEGSRRPRRQGAGTLRRLGSEGAGDRLLRSRPARFISGNTKRPRISARPPCFVRGAALAAILGSRRAKYLSGRLLPERTIR